MILAAHQPNFLPWLGFFDKMRKADLFVVVDHVQFERQNFQNRTMIKTPCGPRWLTVPVRHKSRDERILDKTIDNSRRGRLRWGRKMALTLRRSYQCAPHFQAYAPLLTAIFDEPWDRLTPLNLRCIELLRQALGIRTPILRSSELKLQGCKSDMVLAMCKAVGADTYLSGDGGSRGYLDLAAFQAQGVRVAWQDFRHPRYAQLPRSFSFIEKLSALDLLFNCGPRSLEFFQAGKLREEPVHA
ncbi:MAG: WbqC family protein [Elusimicrobia bacterium]|nr:WbqC family protein [Elusimicrobiota bacterium]